VPALQPGLPGVCGSVPAQHTVLLSIRPQLGLLPDLHAQLLPHLRQHLPVHARLLHGGPALGSLHWLPNRLRAGSRFLRGAHRLLPDLQHQQPGLLFPVHKRVLPQLPVRLQRPAALLHSRGWDRSLSELHLGVFAGRLHLRGCSPELRQIRPDDKFDSMFAVRIGVQPHLGLLLLEPASVLRSGRQRSMHQLHLRVPTLPEHLRGHHQQLQVLVHGLPPMLRLPGRLLPRPQQHCGGVYLHATAPVLPESRPLRRLPAVPRRLHHLQPAVRGYCLYPFLQGLQPNHLRLPLMCGGVHSQLQLQVPPEILQLSRQPRQLCYLSGPVPTYRQRLHASDLLLCQLQHQLRIVSGLRLRIHSQQRWHELHRVRSLLRLHGNQWTVPIVHDRLLSDSRTMLRHARRMRLHRSQRILPGLPLPVCPGRRRHLRPASGPVPELQLLGLLSLRVDVLPPSQHLPGLPPGLPLLRDPIRQMPQLRQ
jgi:hypothetical protein